MELHDVRSISELERLYRSQREQLSMGVREKHRRQEELLEQTYRMDATGRRTEDDLYYTMRNLSGDTAVELGQTLWKIEVEGAAARRSMQYEIVRLEEEEAADRRSIDRLDDEYALRKRALFRSEEER